MCNYHETSHRDARARAQSSGVKYVVPAVGVCFLSGLVSPRSCTLTGSVTGSVTGSCLHQTMVKDGVSGDAFCYESCRDSVINQAPLIPSHSCAA